VNIYKKKEKQTSKQINGKIIYMRTTYVTRILCLDDSIEIHTQININSIQDKQNEEEHTND
jgi:hypothetical protein